MTDQIETYLEQFNNLLNKLAGSHYALVLVTCIVVGYVLKGWKKFPNEAIPVVVVLWGGAFLTMMADPGADNLGVWTWRIKSFLLGIVVGFVAWLLHNQILSRFEDKIPFLKNITAPVEPEQPKSNP